MPGISTLPGNGNHTATGAQLTGSLPESTGNLLAPHQLEDLEIWESIFQSGNCEHTGKFKKKCTQNI